MTSYSERLMMERRARVAATDPRLPEPTREKFKSAAEKLEVANGLTDALERKRAPVTERTKARSDQ